MDMVSSLSLYFLYYMYNIAGDFIRYFGNYPASLIFGIEGYQTVLAKKLAIVSSEVINGQFYCELLKPQ